MDPKTTQTPIGEMPIYETQRSLFKTLVFVAASLFIVYSCRFASLGAAGLGVAALLLLDLALFKDEAFLSVLIALVLSFWTRRAK